MLLNYGVNLGVVEDCALLGNRTVATGGEVHVDERQSAVLLAAEN